MEKLHEIYVPSVPESTTVKTNLHKATIAAAAGGTLISALILLAALQDEPVNDATALRHDTEESELEI